MAKKNSTTALAINDTGSTMLSKGLPDMGDLLAEGFSAEKVVPLEEGDTIRGFFDGEGGPVEVTDPSTKLPRPLRTWRVKSLDGQMTALLLDSAQLGRTFAKLPLGSEVCVTRLPKVRTKQGTFANDYAVFTKLPQLPLPMSR